MKCRTPPQQVSLKWLLPEHAYQRANQQHLQQTHSIVRRHFKRSKLQQPETQTLKLRGIKLVDAELRPVRITGHVDEQIAKQSVHEVRRTRAFRQLAEGNLQLVKRVRTRFIHTRVLTRWPNVHARKQVRHRRMVLPEPHHTAQQIRTAKYWAVRDCCGANDNVTTAACG